MKKILNLIFCFLKSKKIFSVEKKNFIIFDCIGSEILSKILPEDQTTIISSRFNLIKVILINFRVLIFLIKNLFLRSIQINYFISLIDQINPKFVITTIDNSITFSILAKYFENKIKFIPIQNATRRDFTYTNQSQKKNFYFTNYLGLSEFDHSFMRNNGIKVKNFIAAGSLKSSYFRNIICDKEIRPDKKYDICLVGKNIFNKESNHNNTYLKPTLKIFRYAAKYAKKFNKSLLISTKSFFNNEESETYKEIFRNTKYHVSWFQKDDVLFKSYKNVFYSKLIIGAPSTLLREASAFPDTKIICFETTSNKKDTPFSSAENINNIFYEIFEQKLNLIEKLQYEEYLKSKYYEQNVIKNINTVKFLINSLEKKQSIFI
jgi:surface carbohydrate biosynthesis protein